MATIGVQSSQQCEQCHQRSKHLGSQFCSKGCATAAASGSNTAPAATNSLCLECGQRTKCQGFDYCSKGCASKATQGNPNSQNSIPSQVSASSKPQVISSKLCVVCQQRPRFQKHEYCGKTCAAKGGQSGNVSQINNPTPVSAPTISGSANNLCPQCLQKPKFSGHDFCSKSCAATWKTNNP